MELKIFRDALPAAGTNCTLKAELPLETEILISDYLTPVFKLVKCFVRPVVLQKRLQPGKLQLEGYLRCVVYYQGEDGAGLCQTEQKLPFTKLLDLPEFVFTAWAVQVEGRTEYLNCRTVNPRRIEVRGAYGLVVSVHTQVKTDVITALSDGGVEQKLVTLSHAARRRFGPQRQCLCRRPQAPERESRCQGRAGRFLCLACRWRPGTAEPEREPELQSGAGCGRPERGLPLPLRGRAGGLYAHRGRRGGTQPPDCHPDAAPAGMEALSAAVRGGCLLHEI